MFFIELVRLSGNGGASGLALIAMQSSHPVPARRDKLATDSSEHDVACFLEKRRGWNVVADLERDIRRRGTWQATRGGSGGPDLESMMSTGVVSHFSLWWDRCRLAGVAVP